MRAETKKKFTNLESRYSKTDLVFQSPKKTVVIAHFWYSGSVIMHKAIIEDEALG